MKGIDNMDIKLLYDYKCVPLEQINPGDCFMFNNHFYIKTDKVGYASFKCVNLENGILADLRSTSCVDVLDANLCVKRIFDDTDK